VADTLTVGSLWKLFRMSNGGDLYSKFNLILRFTKPPKLQKFSRTIVFTALIVSANFIILRRLLAFLRRNYCSPRQSPNKADGRNSCNILLLCLEYSCYLYRILLLSIITIKLYLYI